MTIKGALSEADVRKLRDRIYGRGSDKSWEGSKAAWLMPECVEWMQDYIARNKRERAIERAEGAI
jgi:hypothetical protein